MSVQSSNSDFEAFGPNSGLVEEMYQQYLENPSTVGDGWIDFFKDYKPRAARDSRSELTTAPAVERRSTPSAAPATAAAPKSTPINAGEESVSSAIRGVGAKIVENMEDRKSVV